MSADPAGDEIVVVAHERDRLTGEQTEALAEYAMRWMERPENRQRFEREREQTEQLLARLRRLRRVDPEILQRPMSV